MTRRKTFAAVCEAERIADLPPLTEDQLAAVRAFASHKGRYWKADLNCYWQDVMRTTCVYTPVLQHLRNTHGPRWLASFRLPTQEA